MRECIGSTRISFKYWINFQNAKACITSSQQKQRTKDHIVVKKHLFSGLSNELFIPYTQVSFLFIPSLSQTSKPNSDHNSTVIHQKRQLKSDEIKNSTAKKVQLKFITNQIT
jgi:hypothetical protein